VTSLKEGPDKPNKLAGAASLRDVHLPDCCQMSKFSLAARVLATPSGSSSLTSHKIHIVNRLG